MKHYEFKEILDTYNARVAECEFKGNIPLTSESFLHELRTQDGVHVETIQITYAFIIGSSDSSKKWAKHLAQERAEKMYCKELAQAEDEAKKLLFLEWAVPFAQQNKGVTIDAGRLCVWFEHGGENEHFKYVQTFSRHGGMSGGGYANGNANPSAFSLEEAQKIVSDFRKPKLRKRI